MREGFDCNPTYVLLKSSKIISKIWAELLMSGSPIITLIYMITIFGLNINPSGLDSISEF